MATPPMTASSFNAQVVAGSAGRIRIDTLDVDGAALSVAAGYVMDFFKAAPSSDANEDFGPVDLSALVTPAFDATGVSLNYTGAQATSIAAALPTLRSNCAIGLSNDAGTTATLAATGTITVIGDDLFTA